MIDQLDLFHQPPDEPAPPDPEPVEDAEPRRTQLTHLPGTTFEHIFAGPPSRTRDAA